MTKDLELRIREAKKSMSSAEDLISDYIPFIKSQVSKASNKRITESDDEYSIGMIAFHEDLGSLMDTIQDERDHYQEFDLQSDLKKEILLLTEELKDFDITLTEIEENTPKQDRTLRACRDICN